MDYRFKKMLLPLMITLFLLVSINFILSMFTIGNVLSTHTMQFNVVIIIFLCLQLKTPWLPILIFVIQFFHNAFTLDGWAYGTLVGVLLSFLLMIVKDVVNTENRVTVIIINQIFQIIWYLFMGTILWIQGISKGSFWHGFFVFLPGSFFVSLLSPVFFNFLNKIWKSSSLEETHMGNDV
ncbi:MAG: hypothetical protein KBD63_03205 [Bacteriovoracaceae bacterium]|nr:hypothetical protein [Bacteriovoracaceae bacterium]